MAGAATGDVAHAGLPIRRFYSSGPNLIFRNQVRAQRILIRESLAVQVDRAAGRGLLITHIEDLVARAKILAGIAMTAQAPLHLEGRVLIHQRHLVDGTVTCVAADALVDVNAVIKEDEVGELIDASPLQRFAGTIAGANRLKQLGIGPDLRVAIHAGLRRRNTGEARVFHRGVTIAAVNAESSHVMLMTERHRLGLADTGVSYEGGSLNGIEDPSQSSNNENSTEDSGAGQRIRAAMKDLRHFSL